MTIQELIQEAFPGSRSPAQDAARFLDTQPSTVYRWLSSQSHPPRSALIALRAAAFLGTDTFDDLF